MKLWEYVGKKVKLFLSNGTVVVGKVTDWFDGYELDGDDEIVIEFQSYPENQIKSIEIV